MPLVPAGKIPCAATRVNNKRFPARRSARKPKGFVRIPLTDDDELYITRVRRIGNPKFRESGFEAGGTGLSNL